jgi:hypothetical protein
METDFSPVPSKPTNLTLSWSGTPRDRDYDAAPLDAR